MLKSILTWMHKNWMPTIEAAVSRHPAKCGCFLCNTHKKLHKGG